MTDTEKALDELANLVGGGGLASSNLLTTLGATWWVRVNAASATVRWVPEQRIRLTCVSAFNVGQTVVVSRSPFVANDINAMPNGAMMNDNIICYFPVPAGGTVPLAQLHNLWEHLGHDENDGVYVSWTSNTQGWIMLHYVIVGQR